MYEELITNMRDVYGKTDDVDAAKLLMAGIIAIRQLEDDRNAVLCDSEKLREALGDYMSQFGQALDMCQIPYGPAQKAADEKARAALEWK